MKVALFTSVYPPRIGGPSTQARHLAKVLTRTGWDTVVVTFGESNDKGDDDGTPVHYLKAYDGAFWGPAAQYTNFVRRLFAVLRAERPDVFVYLSGCDYGCGPAGLVARALGLPRLAKFAGDLVWEVLSRRDLTEYAYPEIHHSSPMARALSSWQRFALRQYSLVWATSAFQEGILREVVGLRADRIHRMPNYVSVSNEGHDGRSDHNGLIFLSVCRFEPWKRVEDVIAAFAQLDHSAHKLRLVGGENPPLERKLKALADDLGVSESVEFVGPVSPVEVKQEYARADVFVSASVYEPFGIACVEAMEAGLSVVATKVGGVAEVVEDGVTGILVSPGDLDGLASVMKQLSGDVEARRRMGEAAQRRAHDFDLDTHMDDVLELLSKAIG